MNRAKIQDYIDRRVEERKGVFHSEMTDSSHFLINKHPYVIVADPDNSFNLESFTDRFSTILSKYDFIVGDWGYGQLRLRGFFDHKNPEWSVEKDVDTIQDYLYEECNFGCSYFILHNLQVQAPRKKRQVRRSYKHSKNKTRQYSVHRPHNGKQNHFIIRKRKIKS